MTLKLAQRVEDLVYIPKDSIAFCNYLANEFQALEGRDFQTFRNEAVKLLSGIQGIGKDSPAPTTLATYTF